MMISHTGNAFGRRRKSVTSDTLADAKLFLESLAPVEESMRALDSGEIERKLEKEQQLRLADRRRLYGGD